MINDGTGGLVVIATEIHVMIKFEIPKCDIRFHFGEFQSQKIKKIIKLLSFI